eukprot:3018666-Amphidinium_carterae.2
MANVLRLRALQPVDRKLDVLLTMNPAGSICSACARSKGVNGYQELAAQCVCVNNQSGTETGIQMLSI